MFSTGQLIFAGIFFVVFAIVIAIMYRKDLKLHKKYYRGSIFVLLAFILFMAFLFLIKLALAY